MGILKGEMFYIVILILNEFLETNKKGKVMVL